MKVIVQIFEAVLIASRDAAILALGVGLILLLFRRLPPVWRHGLWMLVAVRLLMPVLPESILSWRNWWVSSPTASTLENPGPIPYAGDDFGPQNFTAIPVERIATAQPASVTVAPSNRWTLRNVMPWVWSTGTSIWLILLAWGWLRFQRQVWKLELRRHPRRAEVDSTLSRLCEEQKIMRVPGLVLTDAVDGPALAGWWRPRILLPGASLTGLSEPQLRLVILHELGHLRRRDVAVNWLLCLIQAVHWFNPVIWWAFRRTRIEAERATDAWVLRRSGAGTSADYGETLIRLLESIGRVRPVAPGLVGVIESRLGLRARLSEIRRYRTSSRWLAAAGLIILAGFAAVGLTQPPKVGEEQPVEEKEQASGESSTTELGNATQVQLMVKVWQKANDGTEELIATPSIVSLLGEWSLFEDRQEIGYPTHYDLPNLPEELAAKASGGGTIVERDPAAKNWEINQHDVILPPHPTDFERRKLGWTLKLRPEKAADGKLRVLGVVEQEGLKGFQNSGLPIIADQPTGLFGKTKPKVVEENRQLLPVFLKSKRELIFEAEGDRLMSRLVSDSGPNETTGEKIVEGFAERLRSPELPELRFEVEAKMAEELDEEGAESHQKQRMIHVSTRFVEGALPSAPAGPTLSYQILTDPQYQVVIRALSQQKGTDLLSAPSLSFESGSSVLIDGTKEFFYPERYDAPILASEPGALPKPGYFPASPSTPRNFKSDRVGVSLQVIGTILSDDRIELELVPWSGEFREFLNFGTEIRLFKEGKATNVLISENRMDMPVFDVKSQRMKLRLKDGETVCIGGFIKSEVLYVEDRLPLIGTVVDAKTMRSNRYVSVFVTSRLMDPSGTPVKSHTDSPSGREAPPRD